jgi:hypothetical protein
MPKLSDMRRGRVEMAKLRVGDVVCVNVNNSIAWARVVEETEYDPYIRLVMIPESERGYLLQAWCLNESPSWISFLDDNDLFVRVPESDVPDEFWAALMALELGGDATDI